MMTHDAVRLFDSYYLIDTEAWLRQRTGEHQAAQSTAWQAFTGCQVFDEHLPAMDIAARMQLWCAATGLLVGDGTVIEHDSETLTRPVSIVLAAAGSPRLDALALVSIKSGPPQVFADVTTDEGYWREHTRIEIVCSGGLCWTWDGGAMVIAADGGEHRVTTVFGLGGQVIRRCRDCAAFEDGDAETVCPCSGMAIYCPHCGQRARVRLPEVPTFDELRR